MKLYYSPGACSLSPHIVLREMGLTFELEKVDLQSKKTESGSDFRSVNPNGYVPLLALDDGQVLTEGPAIVQYLADRAPEARLAPEAGTMERYRLVEWLNFISTELHKAFAPLFNPKTPEEWKAIVNDLIAARLAYVEKKLDGQAYLMGDNFTVADAYLFTVLSWGKWVGVDIGRWPTLQSYTNRISSRPTVQAALRAEGLI
ncbi:MULTISPECIES: glutathione transferase GstA [Burkholderiaceae]|jgi:glutathione S-transferase|uniref:Glutathione transferase GstA n=3 Tax=Burkholderiaceae TaxID=119060 RepID=A0A248VYE2_9BURK|nr:MULTISPECIES: glutathione transferase GstA [Burkholderiaceae]AHB75335.1 glutathione transferase GstA [Pandoraea pnomenusa]ASW03977.1 glutathione transferase GstA [Paraburkholderia aromaticivorans]PZR44672.1 MAG: glutathione transferase GstA [Paraburkholderia fungorum]CAB3738919.1 Glutathione S-transferase GST-6.0 [Paraburkholderia phenoliruptrix]HDR9031492.1 glutathione transferase GstA [Burkholderia vietnamiensis]